MDSQCSGGEVGVSASSIWGDMPWQSHECTLLKIPKTAKRCFGAPHGDIQNLLTDFDVDIREIIRC